MKWQPTFTTPLLRSQDWVLPIMILGAIFIHGVAFYLIQASSPPSAKKNTPSARVSVLNSKKNSDQLALEWIENRDPAAISYQTTPPIPAQLFAGPVYEPSYQKNLPEPLPIISEENNLQHRTFFPPGPVPEIKLPSPIVTRQPVQLVSKIIFSPSLDLGHSPPFSPPKTEGELPTSTRFLIVQITNLNEKSLFLLQPSGSDTLDTYARNWLAAAPISMKANQSSGWVQIYWGGEIWKKSAP